MPVNPHLAWVHVNILFWTWSWECFIQNLKNYALHRLKRVKNHSFHYDYISCVFVAHWCFRLEFAQSKFNNFCHTYTLGPENLPGTPSLIFTPIPVVHTIYLCRAWTSCAAVQTEWGVWCTGGVGTRWWKQEIWFQLPAGDTSTKKSPNLTCKGHWIYYYIIWETLWYHTNRSGCCYY